MYRRSSFVNHGKGEVSFVHVEPMRLVDNRRIACVAVEVSDTVAATLSQSFQDLKVPKLN